MRIYTDESCTKADQGSYMLIGGIICDEETSKELRKAIQLLKNKRELPSTFEFHFATMNPNQVDTYKALLDIFIDFYHKKCSYKRGLQQPKIYRCICFEGMLISHEKIDYLKFSKGDAELGFFQFYYTLLAHIFKKHHFSGRQFHVTIDAITTKNPKIVSNLHKRLNGCCLPNVSDPIKNIQRQDSKAEILLQMADVVLGCVSFAWNKSPTQTSKNIDAKREVVKHLENKLDIQLSEPTYSGKSFNIWEFNMQ